MTSKAKRLPPDHPFSLLTLIQPPGRPPGLQRREDDKVGEVVGGERRGPTFLEEDAYRAPSHYQTVPADLSLHSSSFPAASPEPAHLFYPSLAPRPPLPTYDFYPAAGDFPAEPHLPPHHPAQPFADYQEFYDRYDDSIGAPLTVDSQDALQL